MRGRWDDQEIDPATGDAPDAELERGAPRRRERRPRDRSPPRSSAYREAQRRGRTAKLGFMSHLLAYASVCTFLLLVAGFRSAFIVAHGLGHRRRQPLLLRHGRAGPAQALHRARGALGDPAQRAARAAPHGEPARPLARGAVRLDRPRDPQSDHRRQEPGAADGRGPGVPRERRLREGGHRGARPGRALGGAPAALRARGGPPARRHPAGRGGGVGAGELPRPPRAVGRGAGGATWARTTCCAATPRSCAAC